MSAAEPDTLPKLLLHQAARYGARKVAIREKDRGIWRPYTWAEAAEHVRAFALGLAALGFRRGDALSVIGDNRPRLYWAQLAAQALGGIPVPLFQDSIARELQYVLDHAEVKVVVAEDQEQVDKIRGLQGELPHLRQIVFDDARGLGGDRDPSLLAFERVEALGREFGRARPGYVEAEVARGAAGDTALICYTSGTTGHPKGVMLSHRNLIANLDAFLAVERYRDTDELLAYLPMAWIGEVIYSLVGQLLVGYTINCPEAPETVQRDLRELGPTVLLAPPRIWEAMLTTVQVKIEDSDRVKRALYRGAMAVAARILARRAAGQRAPLGLRFLYALGEVVAYGPIRDQLGLGRVRYAYTGGAALGPEIFQFFRGIGLNLKQIYGLTETSAACVVQPDGEVKPESVGRPAPGVEVRISERGEILIRGPGVFQGYYKNEEATREVLEDGWFRTGDAGFFDPDGHLVVIDRAKDLGSLADGTPFAPQFIENKLKFSPYIREAVAVGHGRPYVAAMINIDLGTMGNWAEKRNLAYTSYMDLSQKPEVYALVGEEVRRINAGLPGPTRIRRFFILHKELDPDDAEITRTRKVRRRFIAEKYADLVEALYSDQASVPVATTITYEDGRQATIHSAVRIQEVEGALVAAA